MLEKVKQKGKELKKKACENKEVIAKISIVGASCVAFFVVKKKLKAVLDKNVWNEERDRATWEEIENFCKGIDLKEGEEFMIDIIRNHNEDTEFDILHWIDGVNCYPESK